MKFEQIISHKLLIFTMLMAAFVHYDDMLEPL